MKKIISKRFMIQGLLAISLFMGIQYLGIGLLYIILGGILTGVIFGKAFCRWICPIGFFMEMMFKGSKDQRHQQLYMYYKAGCPIAWMNGFMNKFSIFKIKRDVNSCISCGKCDKACYITTVNPEYSLYKENKLNPSLEFKCSRCLECVKECPINSLKVGI